MFSLSARSHLALKIILSLLPTLVFYQNYAWISSNRWLGIGFAVTWVLLIVSVLNLGDKNRVIEKLLRLTEIGFFLLPLSIIILTFTTASHSITSSSSSLSQGAGIIGVIAGGFIGLVVAFVIGITGGLIMHLLARSYEKKVNESATKETDKVSIVSVVVAIIVFSIISAIAPSTMNRIDSKDSVATSTKESISETKSPASSSDAAYLAEHPGQAIQGDLIYGVLKIFKEKEIKSSLSTTSANGTFHIVLITVGNFGNSTDTVSTSQFSIVDDKGRSYDTSSDGQFAADLFFGSGKTTVKDFKLSNLTYQQVQPSLPINGALVFDLPDDAKNLKLQIKKDISTKESTIDLQPFEEANK